MATSAKSGTNKRSVNIAGHSTSISLEEPFWEALRHIARSQGMATAALVAQIDESRGATGLSSALRLHILAHFRDTDRQKSPL